MSKRIIGITLLIVAVFSAAYVVSQRVDNDKPTSQTTSLPTSSGATLDLSGQQLTSLPDSVLSRTDVTVLNVSNNQLVSLPAAISQFTNLEVLNVENNRLESFPTEISQLTRLREINTGNNRLTSLPPEIGNMTWLKLLDISGNRLPESAINQLKTKLPNTQIKT